MDQCVEDFNGRLDIFVANAGIPWTQGNFLDGSLQQYKSVMSTDLDSTFYCARAAGRHWRRQKQEGIDTKGSKLVNFTYGSFVATASMSGHIVNIPQLQAAYNAAKAGVISLGVWPTARWSLAVANTVIQSNQLQSRWCNSPVRIQYPLDISLLKYQTLYQRRRSKYGGTRYRWGKIFPANPLDLH